MHNSISYHESELVVEISDLSRAKSLNIKGGDGNITYPNTINITAKRSLSVLCTHA